MPSRATVTFTTLLLLLGLNLAGCANRDDTIPPALAELYQQAQAGDAGAQLDLGLRYVTGKGIPPDERAALRWIGKAAVQGHAAAQFELGSYYTLEPHRDFGKAAALLRQSALQGFAPAQSSLAMLYLAGDGVPQDRREAYLWFARAAAQGDPDAVAMVAGAWADLSDAEREQARQRTQRDRQGPR